MRHPYVPLFRDLLDSRVWDEPTATLKVWVWFLLKADPEGFVGGTLRSVARQANVTEDEARDAIAFLCSPDEQSRDDEHGGRMLAVVERGWQVLNLEKWRERARLESQRAANRRYMQRTRASANDTGEEPRGADVESRGVSVEVTRPKTRPIPSVPSEHYSEPESSGPTFTELPEGWQPSEATRARALSAGIPPEYLAERVDTLRGRKLGGKTAITDLDTYVRGLVPRWSRDWQTERFKRHGDAPPAAAAPKRERVPGAPDWVYREHAELAQRRGVDLHAAVRTFTKGYHLPVGGLKPGDLFRPFLEYLETCSVSAA